MKTVSFNSRKKVYIVTEPGKKGIQWQGKNPPEDVEGLNWECENPHKKKANSSEALENSSITIQNESGEKNGQKTKNNKPKGGLFSSLFSD